jgi:hypothetical protein
MYTIRVGEDFGLWQFGRGVLGQDSSFEANASKEGFEFVVNRWPLVRSMASDYVGTRPVPPELVVVKFSG